MSHDNRMDHRQAYSPEGTDQNDSEGIFTGSYLALLENEPLELNAYPSPHGTSLSTSSESPARLMADDTLNESDDGHDPYHNTLDNIHGEEGTKIEEQKEKARAVRKKGACFPCQLKKRGCDEHRPCGKCQKGHTKDWMKCFSFNPIELSVFLTGLEQHHNGGMHLRSFLDTLDSEEDHQWVIDCPAKALGCLAKTKNITVRSTDSSFEFANALEQHFGNEFQRLFTALMNPSVLKVMTATYQESALLTPQMEILARGRARCGQYLLEYISSGRIRALLSENSEEAKVVLFLVLAGTIIAARDCRNLPYLGKKAVAEMEPKLAKLIYQLGACMIDLGDKWIQFNTVEPTKIEKNVLLREMSQNLGLDITRLIREELIISSKASP